MFFFAWFLLPVSRQQLRGDVFNGKAVVGDDGAVIARRRTQGRDGMVRG